jgi:hypothetical protein
MEEDKQERERKREIKRKQKREREKSGLKLHHFRFVKFMEYLKEHDAVISVLPEGASEHTNRRLEYDFKDGDGLKINQLLIQALNIEPDRVQDYITNSGDLKLIHAIGERFRGFGNFITSIEYYFESDTPVDEVSKLADDSSPFNLSRVLFLPANSDKSNVEDLLANATSNFITRQLPKLFERRFNQEKQLDDNPRKRFVKLPYSGFPFKDHLREIEDNLNEWLRNTKSMEYDYFQERRGSMLQTYDALRSDLPKPLFMPGYVDYLIPGGDLDRQKHLYDDRNLLNELLEIPARSRENDLILHRYELIWYLVDQNVPFSDWEYEIQILLLIIFYEHTSLVEAISDLAGRLVLQTRYIVYGSDDGSVNKAQEHGLDIETLAVFLQNYQFKKGLESAFSIHENQILENALAKYPEPGVVKHKKSYESIQQTIGDMLFDFFEAKLKEGYHVP